MKKRVMGNLIRLLFILIILFSANMSLAADIYCRPVAAKNILININNEIRSPFPFGFIYGLSMQTPDEIQAVYDKIKIKELHDDEYQLVIVTKDLKKIYQYRVDFNSNLHELFIGCAKKNNMSCQSLALYNHQNRICLLYSVDYFRSGDAHLDSHNRLTKQLYSFGD